MTTALFIGRFQPFHNAHLKDVKGILKKHKKLIIGIGSSKHKNQKNNPFSYSQRKKIIEKTLKKEKINVKIYPIPDLYNDKKWTDYILKKLPKFDEAYSGNSWTINCFRKHKIKARKIRLYKGISSTIIRNKISKNQKWEHLVPEEVTKQLKNINGVKKIKKAYSN